MQMDLTFLHLSIRKYFPMEIPLRETKVISSRILPMQQEH